MEETEKTLLQQIREKEQEYAEKLDVVKQETDAAIASAQAEGESLLCTADSAAKKEAEQRYWEEKGRIEKEIGALTQDAASERESAAERGTKNIPHAVEAIIGYVTMK